MNEKKRSIRLLWFMKYDRKANRKAAMKNEARRERKFGAASVAASLLLSSSNSASAFVPSCSSSLRPTTTAIGVSSTKLFHWANRLDARFEERSCEDESYLQEEIAVKHKLQPISQEFTRRSILSIGVIGTTLSTLLSSSLPANADFAPGGTLLDRPVYVTYGNSEASPSRAPNNSNVLFSQDNYYKFGSAAPWIEAGSTEFPKSMPFVPSQQRYDALKKFSVRVQTSKDQLVKIGSASSGADVPDSDDPTYQLRALGLLANSFLASENSGTTNELMLARWYINEMYLRIGDYKTALQKGDQKDAETCYGYLIKAMNSYLTLINRSITSKVGDQFSYL
ncbi:hypothetical protein ACHAWT_009574 [Skeletonema menzelii]